MGVATSGWRLARAVSQLGQLGVVSGTLLAVVLARRLQEGDPNGLMRHALAHLPFPQVAERVIDTYYVEGGKPAVMVWDGDTTVNTPAGGGRNVTDILYIAKE